MEFENYTTHTCTHRHTKRRFLRYVLSTFAVTRTITFPKSLHQKRKKKEHKERKQRKKKVKMGKKCETTRVELRFFFLLRSFVTRGECRDESCVLVTRSLFICAPKRKKKQQRRKKRFPSSLSFFFLLPPTCGTSDEIGPERLLLMIPPAFFFFLACVKKKKPFFVLPTPMNFPASRLSL